MKERNSETYIPTQQTLPQSCQRISQKNEDGQRSQNYQQSSPDRPQAIDQSVIGSYPKALRLRTRRDFQRMAHKAQRHVGNLLIIDARANYTQNTRLGITVTKRYGKSHTRNRFKRIVREAFRLCHGQLAQGLDLNVRPRSAACNAKMQDVQAEFLRLLAL